MWARIQASRSPSGLGVAWQAKQPGEGGQKAAREPSPYSGDRNLKNEHQVSVPKRQSLSPHRGLLRPQRVAETHTPELPVALRCWCSKDGRERAGAERLHCGTPRPPRRPRRRVSSPPSSASPGACPSATRRLADSRGIPLALKSDLAARAFPPTPSSAQP